MHMVELNFNKIIKRAVEDHPEISKAKWAEILDVTRTTLFRYLKEDIKNIPETVISKLDSYLSSFGESIKDYLFFEESGYIYHGSRYGLVGNPSLDYGALHNDFGKGFYLGESLYQSSLFVSSYPKARIYKYRLNPNGLNIMHLDGKEWAMFIAQNRGYIKGNIKCDCDVVVGPIADDRMAIVMEDFFSNRIGLDEMLYRLKLMKLGNQYCLRTKKAINHLELIEEFTIEKSFDRYLTGLNISNREEMLERYIEPYNSPKGPYFKEIIEHE